MHFTKVQKNKPQVRIKLIPDIFFSQKASLPLVMQIMNPPFLKCLLPFSSSCIYPPGLAGPPAWPPAKKIISIIVLNLDLPLNPCQ